MPPILPSIIEYTYIYIYIICVCTYIYIKLEVCSYMNHFKVFGFHATYVTICAFIFFETPY